MLPEKTYLIRFAHLDCFEIEEQEYTCLPDAWEAFRLFTEPDSAEMYSRIELTEYTWKNHTARIIAALEFAAPAAEPESSETEDEYTPSCTAGDYGPGNPWDAPGMSIEDFI